MGRKNRKSAPRGKMTKVGERGVGAILSEVVLLCRVIHRHVQGDKGRVTKIRVKIMEDKGQILDCSISRFVRAEGPLLSFYSFSIFHVLSSSK